MQRILKTLVCLFGCISLLAVTMTFPVAKTRVFASPIQSPDITTSSLMFIENVGQFDEGARFQVRGGNSTIWLAEDGIWITLLETPEVINKVEDIALYDPLSKDAEMENTPGKGVNIKLSFDGANPNPILEPFDRLETSVNYFIGNDPEKWHSDVPVWGGVRYTDLYPGIDLEVSGEDGHTVQRLVANEGVDLNQVKLNVEGAQSITLKGDQILLKTILGDYSLPLLTVNASSTVSFPITRIVDNQILAPFAISDGTIETQSNRSVTLELFYSSFIGGSDYEFSGDIVVNSSGSAFVTGSTLSSDFPTTLGVFDVNFNSDFDIFVVKLNINGSALSFATFLGGSKLDYGNDIALDTSGAAYVTGTTTSTDFPATTGSYDTSYNSEFQRDAYIVKMNPTGSDLIYSSYIGGSYEDQGYSITVDNDGMAYITGETSSFDFPSTLGSFDNSKNVYDAFVVKMNVDGSALTYATFVGGSSYDYGYDIAVDVNGMAYITGSTMSMMDFPTTTGSFNTSCSGTVDSFIVKLNQSGSGLSYSTCLGGWSAGKGISVDLSGAAYVVGYTNSNEFPTTPGAFDTSLSGNDVFVLKMNSMGSALIFSTFLGGSNNEIGLDISVDASGGVYIVGYTESPDFPTTSNAFDTSFNGFRDVFVSKLNSSGSILIYGTFLGGYGRDEGSGIDIDFGGAIYVTGITYSNSFPTSTGAFDTILGGETDAFVTKLDVGSHFISGSIKNDLDTPKPGVLITLSDGQTTSTGSDGSYQFIVPGLSTYTITPSLIGYRFAPESATIDLTKKKTQDFIIRPNTPVPFLGLPFELPTIVGFSDQEVFSIFASGNINSTGKFGRVNSWFDHSYPTYTNAPNLGTNNIRLWNGRLYDFTLTHPTIGISWYDGHNGLDFHMPLGTDVLASADGEVVYAGWGCLGNHVVIDHDNGYFSVYGHLRDFPTVSGHVVQGSVIGKSGSTYDSSLGCTSDGAHLHFSIYYDINGNGEKDNFDDPVDPYGWKPIYAPGLADPWEEKSFYLWKYRNDLVCTITNTGTTQKSSTGMLTMDIPAGAVTSDVTLEILDVSPIAETSASLRFTGQSFFTQILEWLTGSSTSLANPATQTEATGFAQPVTMTVNYDPDQLHHLDLSNLALYTFDTSGVWVGLPSTIDMVNHTVSAQTYDVGNFTLQAPLLCEAAFQEPNDNYDSSIHVLTDGGSTSDNFDIQTDEDWYRFEGIADTFYLLETSNLSTETDTIIEIYGTDGVTLLSTDDNSGGGFSSRVQWEAPDNGVYYVRVIPTSTSHIGCDTTYKIGITKLNAPPAPTLTTPEDGLFTNIKTPSFSWETVTGGDHYQIQISQVPDFSTNLQNALLLPGILSYTADLLSDGVYYWRLRAFTTDDIYGYWSITQNFTIDSVATAIPNLKSPSDGATVRGTPTYIWTAALDAIAFLYQYDDNSDFSSPIFTSDELTTTSFTPPLQAPGIYYWHVKARDAAGNWTNWSDSRTITIKPLIPVVPVLVSPVSGKYTNDNTPTFTWKSVPDGYKYRIQISKTSNFTTPIVKNILLSPGVLTYTAPQLANGKYYWRVMSINVLSEGKNWSAVRNFTVDTVKPAAPLLSSPANGVSITYIPTYKWQTVIGAKYYQFSYATNSAFTTGVFTSTKLTVLSFKPAKQAKGTWYWRVRAQDAAGNWSNWSTVRMITIR